MRNNEGEQCMAENKNVCMYVMRGKRKAGKKEWNGVTKKDQPLVRVDSGKGDHHSNSLK